MKRTIIGSAIMLAGVITTISLLVSAALFVPHISTWRGPKLWFAIFGANDIPSSQSLSVGLPFVIGLILFFVGLLILIIEYCKQN